MIGLTRKDIPFKVGKDNMAYYDAYLTGAEAQLKKFREWLKDDVLEDCHDGYSNVMCFHKRALKALLEE